MSKPANIKPKYHLVPDWELRGDECKKDELEVRIHPYNVIRFTHKKWGIDLASDVAINVLKSKYNDILEQTKVVSPSGH